jgi:hypothetical protein
VLELIQVRRTGKRRTAATSLLEIASICWHGRRRFERTGVTSCNTQVDSVLSADGGALRAIARIVPGSEITQGRARRD